MNEFENGEFGCKVWKLAHDLHRVFDKVIITDIGPYSTYIEITFYGNDDKVLIFSLSNMVIKELPDDELLEHTIKSIYRELTNKTINYLRGCKNEQNKE